MKYILADHTYDAALRRIICSTSMPGSVRITFGREPDFFYGLDVQGKQNQTLVALEDGVVVGLGCRTIKPVYVNKQRIDLGYLNGLRLLPHVRRRMALARGYSFLERLHADRCVPAYLSTIVEENHEAISLLTSGRAGLPRYEDYGQYYTYALLVGKKPRRVSGCCDGLTILPGHQTSMRDIIDFLNTTGRRRQFFPVLEESDLGTSYLRDLRPDNFHVAIQGNKIVGAVASWDQNAFKQTILSGYSGWARLVQPLASRILSLAGCGALPQPGTWLNVCYASFLCVDGDDSLILERLVDALCTKARFAGHQFILLGFHENDPLRNAMQKFLTIQYRSRVYLVYWDDGLNFCQTIDKKQCPYLELGAL
ncbi:MAG: hypothetical protein A2X46_06535 [Lentisphaerae bacterium GWF2_57_35]|nr:MAG: hypothetical protein A2X46_06535 [Lentisphaerae bacterium GWF2_57_35]